MLFSLAMLFSRGKIMTKFAILITALFALFALTGQAAETVLSSYLIPAGDRAQLEQISRFFDLEHKSERGYEVILPASQAAFLLSLAPRATLLEKDVSAAIAAQLRGFDAAQFRAEHRYHSFDEVQAWMRSIQNSHADIARVVQYGTSRGGRPLTALRISSDPEDSPGRPQVMLTAATHGDELITTEVLMHLAEQLARGNGNIDRMSRIVQSKIIYIIPVVNADGFAGRNRYDGNADPNRSYPFPGNHNVTPTPSIKALIDFFHSKNIAASIDFHAYGEMVMFPWGYTRAHIDPAPFARMSALTRSMAELNRYEHGPIAEVIYVAQGSSADYYFWKKATLGIAVEIGHSKVPNPSSFPAAFTSQEESTWRLLESI